MSTEDQEKLATGGEAEERAPEIHNRFLFVDVAAQRAKQLRRGALPRLGRSEADASRVDPQKLERVAMEEVRHGIIHYALPDLKTVMDLKIENEGGRR
jgi:DNA-directed RNA polymerase subunit K/omega